MGGNTDSDDFDADDDDDVSADDELDVDRVIKDMEIAKRRSPRGGEPAWRRLEQRLEQKRTSELISDFEDYDVPAEAPGGSVSAASDESPGEREERSERDPRARGKSRR